MGAIMHPRAYAVLYIPVALSLIVPESHIPSFSLTPSIISDKSGTNIMEQQHPRIARPIVLSVMLTGKLNTFDGPNMKRAIEADTKAKKVIQCRGIREVKQPTKGDMMA